MLKTVIGLTMKTFTEANEALSRFWQHATPRKVPTLEHMLQLMEFLGNPQDKLKVVHVAGTSGKTSTTYYAAALLKAAGKKVGLTVSPHVDVINERVQIDLTPLPEARFCAELEHFLGLVKQSGLAPTYAELLMAFAFWEFVRSEVEYAAVEVGFGGLLDGSNVVHRADKVCVITDIGLDHIHRLGETLKDIAEHKAGIIQLHNSVFSYRQSKIILHPILERARQMQADVHTLEPEAVQRQLADLPLFQQRNLGLARAAVNQALTAQGSPELTDDMVAMAAKTYIPARMEAMSINGTTVIVDCAHNAQKLHALGESLRAKYHNQTMAAVVSLADGRDYRLEDAAEELTGLFGHIIITTFSGPQDGPNHSVNSQGFAEILQRKGAPSVEIIADPEEALQALLKRSEPVRVVTGSFYLLNHIRPHLRHVMS
jgi:dihydrofolate synthase / folylpolyglutamate synthase